jgi:hypothetical protein
LPTFRPPDFRDFVLTSVLTEVAMGKSESQ